MIGERQEGGGGVESVVTVSVGWLIDGSGGKIRENILLRIRGGRIQRIDRADIDHTERTPRIDLSDCTVLPGLIDAHLHLFMSGTPDRKIREMQLDAPYREIRPVIQSHIRQLLSAGVAAVRDGGDRNAHALRYKKELQRPGAPLQIKAAGQAWHGRNRYGRLIGRAPGETISLDRAVAQDLDPIDHVKIVNSGLNSLLCFGRQTPPQFPADEMRCAVEAAGLKRLPVMVHANGIRAVAESIEAGCRSIEHGFFMGKENLKKMAERNIFWVPTAFTMKAYARYFEGTDTDVPRRNLEHQMEQMAAGRALGVSMAVGTDSGSIGVHHGISMAEEIEIFLKAGFSITEAVRCATANGADLLGLEDMGRIRPGAKASFLAVKGPPSGLPESLRRIHGLWIDGCPHNPDPQITQIPQIP